MLYVIMAWKTGPGGGGGSYLFLGRVPGLDVNYTSVFTHSIPHPIPCFGCNYNYTAISMSSSH